MITKEEAYLKVSELVERFTEQLPSYKKADYNETLTRQDFINPFFKALGWDVDNSFGNAEAYREVIHEDKVKVGGATKAPDYSFRLPGGHRLFFVEAKKPNVVVRDEILPAYQVRRYGWSAKLPISLITDFEEFAIYDCTKKPNPTDKASHGRIKYLTFKDYLHEFDFIWDTFSKERVLKGSFDKFIKSDTNKKGTATVDKDFLASLDEWRKQLALNIALRNQHLSEDDLNFVVQQTLDRIIFLRIAEDRGVEEYGELKKLISSPTGGGQEGASYYQQLYSLFKEADSKYNSGLFDFKKDHLSHSISIDNKVIKSIINELYYPISPYEFSVLSVEILGSAYEQFLGKQIKLDKHHRAVIEEKPEVRKAGGVYYTPQYIVNYIVENTVGKKIEELEKVYNDEKASPTGGGLVGAVSKLTIVDPACGSGSFLLGAYDYLLKWHLLYYKPEFTELSEKAANRNLYNTNQRQDFIKQRNRLPLTPEGHLTTGLKKQILLNNIYGVDIDTQAVEVTKLSLLLKCMEGETASSINAEMRFGERVLPTLDNNIKSGNSLIDLDFYDTQIDFGEEKKIKPFNWRQAFPNVFNADKGSSLRGGTTKQSADGTAGFDVVIGNPPYVRQEMLGDIKPYLQKKYKVFNGMADLYSYFFERGIGLLNNHGLFGIIVANKWMRANYGEPLRRWLKQQTIYQIVDFGDLPVFQNATTYPCIIIAGKEVAKGGIEPSMVDVVNVKTLSFETLQQYIHNNRKQAERNSLEDAGWNLGSDAEQKLLKKLQKAGVTLEIYVEGKIYYGIKTGLNEAFVIDKKIRDKLIQEDTKSAEVIKPFLAGKDIKRYYPPESDKHLIFTKRGIDIDKYPAIKKHLNKFKEQLIPKPKDLKGDEWKGRKPGTYKWYEIQDAVDYHIQFENKKILLPDIALRLQGMYDDKGFYCVNTAYIIPVDDKYLLGVLNSNLIQFIYSKISSSIRGGYLRFIRQYLEVLPIIRTDKRIKTDIISLVEQMIHCNKEKQTTTLAEKIEQLNQRIAYTDEKINKLVYELYGLSEEVRL